MHDITPYVSFNHNKVIKLQPTIVWCEMLDMKSPNLSVQIL